MNVFDLNHFDPYSVLETDLCIVGTGPAGLSIANECAGSSIRVLVLESGGLEEDEASRSLYEIESTGARRVMDQSTMRTRVLGGTSHIWTGRCAPFEALDFEPRPWISASGWPVKRAALDPYLERSAPYLGLAAAPYDERLWKQFRVRVPAPHLEDASLRPIFWQFSRRRSGPGSAHFGRDWVDRDAPNVEILLHANVTQVNVSADGSRYESVEISSLCGRRAQIRSTAVVLCCGGIENARLLLASNRMVPQGVGNQRDVVGRYLMDHLNCTAGFFAVDEAAALRGRFGHYWLDDATGRHVFLHGLGLSEEAQRREGLVNCHAYTEEGGPAQSEAWEALKRLRNSARSGRVPLSDVGQVVRHMDEVSGDFYRRQFKHRPRLGTVRGLELHLMLEQAPDRESRVTLSPDKRDALGMPISRIHWKIGVKERTTAGRMVRLVAKEFRRLGFPEPQTFFSFEEQDDWLRCSTEKAHPTGSTRMSADPGEGVVDTNCEVHGVRGLFLAGSSIFPTTGAANPTLMIVAMAVRLADHLKSQLEKTRDVVRVASTPALREQYSYASRQFHAPEALRVGFVGAGRRAATLHLPILRQMPELFQVVGFTSVSPTATRRFQSQTGIASFRNAGELVEQARPELLIVAVPDRLNEATVAGLLGLGVPILAETPLAWTIAGADRILQKAEENKLLLGVSEQFPFQPLDQFRWLLHESGVLGEIHTVLNNFESYSYHGIAQLRRFLKGKPIEARCNQLRSNGSTIDGVRTEWQTGSITFDDRSLLLHNFAAPDGAVPKNVCLLGKRGAMEGDVIRLSSSKSGEWETYRAERLLDVSGKLVSIGADLGAAGQIAWENPFAAYAFSDEQIAVATLLDGMRRAIREGQPVLYTGREFRTDIEIIQALRYSADRDGAMVPLPLRAHRQQALTYASPSYWKRKLIRR